MPKIRWLMIAMCFLANAISYIDRANLAIAAPTIRAELGINAAEMGLVLSAFFWTYAVMQLPAGWFIDRLGVGEAFSLPSFTRVAFNWFPRSERGMACGIFNSGSTTGSALSLPLVTALIVAVGWRGAFAATGLLGIVWVLAWWFIYRDPEKYRAIAPAQVDALLAQRGMPAAPAAKISWADLFRYRSIWGLMIGLFCLNFAIYFFITWFPSYLLQARGFSLASLGTLGMVPALMAILGNWLGGYVSDRLLRAGWSPTKARKTCLVGGMMVASSIGLSAFVDSTLACLALFSLAYAALSFTGANVWTVASEIAPTKDHVASIGGIQNFAGNLAGILITTFTGVMLVLTKGSFLIPLAVAGGLCVVGALSYLFIVGKVEPLPLLPGR
ncbi:MAG: MFS transporter [Alphaproteobacteria bacterium]|nr:MFS transporter [Alphaproteobacteria bacterium]